MGIEARLGRKPAQNQLTKRMDRAHVQARDIFEHFFEQVGGGVFFGRGGRWALPALEQVGQLFGQRGLISQGQFAGPDQQAFLDFHGGFARECDGQNGPRMSAGLDAQAQKTIDQHLGLARSGRGAQGN